VQPIPILENALEASRLDKRDRDEIGRADDAFSSERRIHEHVAVTARKPAAYLDRVELAVALELPEIEKRAARIAKREARVPLEVRGVLHAAMRAPILGGGDDRVLRLGERALHEGGRVVPAEEHEHIDGARLEVSHLVHDLEVETDFRVPLVEARQEWAHAVLQREGGRADDHFALRPLDGRAHRFIHGRQLLEQRPAALEIALAVGRERKPVHAAVEEARPQPLLEGGHHLRDRRDRDLESARRA
jgi:hypothetical protein